MRNYYPIHRGLFSLLVLCLLSALTFRSQAQSGSVTTTQSFSYTGQIVTWTVPTGVTSLTITARGAEGGLNSNGATPTPGLGAVISGIVPVSGGLGLKILVGQQPGQSQTSFREGAGGGGTFVTLSDNTPLVIAGGGGGATFDNSRDSNNKQGQITTSGATGGGNGSPGGSDGQGGGAGGSFGGSGGGLLTNGANGAGGSGGQSFIAGGAGGAGGTMSTDGGFGGGGGAEVFSGGGGGYSGGGAGGRGSTGGSGGGGGSYNAGTSLSAVAGSNPGNGLVTITYEAPPQPIRYVKPVATGTGDGTSWANASGDLQSQIDIAGAQQVWVAGGRYTTTANGGSFSLKNGVAVYGGFAGSENSLTDRPAINSVNGQPSSTTLTTASRSAVINTRDLDNTARLDGVVITGGNNNFGGGIYNSNSSPVLTNCTISGNTATQLGGGLFNTRSSPVLTNCLISGNSVSNLGGGIYNDSSSPVLTNCFIRSNTASRQGGGLFNNSSSSPSLTNCTISGNTASDQGGGILNKANSSPVLTNCLLANNTATNQGGAIHNFDGSNPRLVNCTLSGNSASDQGGAISEDGTTSQLTNAILFNNGGAKAFRFINNGSTSLTYSLIEQGATGYTSGPGNLTATVSPFTSGTDFTLKAGSQAIDAGDPASTTATSGATDLAGNPRVLNNRIDQGAYEYQGPFCQPIAITQQPTSGSSVCVGSTVTAMISVTGTSPTYQWYKDGQALTGVTSATTSTLRLINVQTSDAGNYSVVVSGSCNSVTSTAFSLSVNPVPSATLSASPSTTLTCAQTSLTLTAGGGNAWETLSYAFSPNVVSQSGNMAVVNTSGTYSVTVTNTASGCFSTTSISISQDNIAPMASLASSGPLTCAVTSVTLTASPNGQTYVFGPGTSPIGSSNQATVSSPGMYSVTVISANGCSGVGSVSVSQDITPPVATISGNLTLTSGGSTTLTASGGTSQRWSTGETTPSIVVMAGTYSVTVVNASGCNSSTSVTVSLAFGSGALSVLHQDVSFGQTTTNTILPYLQLANSGSAPIAYSAITVRYWLTVEGNSPITNFQNYYVQIGANNVHERYAPLAMPRQGATAYVEYSFDAAAGNLGGGTNSGPIQNGFGKVDYSAFNQSDDYSYVANRDYVANARITAYVNGFLVYGQEPSDLGPVSPLMLSLTANPTTLTTSGTTTLSATVSGGTAPYNYTFTGPGTVTPSGNTASVSGLPAGVQTYTVVVRDATSPTSQTIAGTVSVTVTPAPVNTAPVATANNNQTATVGVSFNYPVNAFTDAETPSGLTYQVSINPANGLSFDPVTRIISGTPSMSGVSSVTVTATDPGSLSASTTFTITVSPAPVVGNAQLTVLHQDVSFGQTTTNTILPYLQLANSGSAPLAYQSITVRYWLTVEGNSPITNFQHYYVQIGANNVHERYVPLATPRQGATAYVEYSFDAAAGSLGGGTNSGPIQNGFTKADYSFFNQSDDYSYAANRDYTPNARITAYVNGVLVYGQEPPVGVRVGATTSEVPLRVQVLGNPLVNEVLEVMVSGGEGQSLVYQLTDTRGRVVVEQRVDQAGSPDHQRLSVRGQSAGVLLLRVSTPRQSQTVKVLKGE